MNLTGKGGFQDRKHQINKRGRPPSADKIRALAQQIGREKITDKDGSTISLIEGILRGWSRSEDLQAQQLFVAYGWGKPTDKLEVESLHPNQTLILHYAHERPDWRKQPDGPIIGQDGPLGLP